MDLPINIERATYQQSLAGILFLYRKNEVDNMYKIYHMKLNIFLLFLSICGLFSSCSDDDKIQEEVKHIPDATLSIAVKDESARTRASQTRADVDPGVNLGDIVDVKNTDGYINSLTVAVFNDGAYPDMVSGELIVLKHSLVATSERGGVTSVEQIPVKSGKVKLLVFANVPALKFEGLKTLDAFMGDTLHLDRELNGNIVMTSGVISTTLLADIENKIGVDSDNKNAGIPLYRVLARVQLYNLQFDPKDEYSENATLTPLSLFLANVKNSSYMEAENACGALEIETETDKNQIPLQFWCGSLAVKDETGNMKKFANSVNESLLWYDFTNSNQTYKDFLPNVDPCFQNRYFAFLPINEVLDPSKKDGGHISVGGGFPLGRMFYVYENQDEEMPTLMVVKARLSYKDKKTGLQVSNDYYYTLIVNKTGKVENFSDIVHSYIKRNKFYTINMIIRGPGSDKPFDLLQDAYASVAVKVSNWKIVDMSGTEVD